MQTLKNSPSGFKRSFGFLPASGFTLAELLIALAILGEIATFTIPKILFAQQTSKYRAIAREDMSSLSQAVQVAKLSSSAAGTITDASLTPYLNYTTLDTTGQVDSVPNDTVATYSCSLYTCLKLHNGSVLLLTGSISGNTGMISGLIDPNGYQGQKDSMIVYVLGTGRLASTEDQMGTTAYTPSWYSW